MSRCGPMWNTAPPLRPATTSRVRSPDVIVGVGRNAKPTKLMNHPGRRSRRIGDKNHRPAVGAVSHERVAGVRMSRDPIMNHAPDIAQDDVIARRNGGETIEKMKGHTRYQGSGGAGVRILGFRGQEEPGASCRRPIWPLTSAS